MSKKEKIKQDWTCRRKKIYKGKYAPPGQLFLVISVRKRYEGALLINGGQGEQAEYDAQLFLREQIREKYGK